MGHSRPESHMDVIRLLPQWRWMLGLALAAPLAFVVNCQPGPQATPKTTGHGPTGAAVQHDFFPLTGGHQGLDCSQCHTRWTTRKVIEKILDDAGKAKQSAQERLAFPKAQI